MAAPILPPFTGCGPCPPGYICPAVVQPCPPPAVVPTLSWIAFPMLILFIILIAAILRKPRGPRIGDPRSIGDE